MNLLKSHLHVQLCGQGCLGSGAMVVFLLDFSRYAMIVFEAYKRLWGEENIRITKTLRLVNHDDHLDDVSDDEDDPSFPINFIRDTTSINVIHSSTVIQVETMPHICSYYLVPLHTCSDDL